MSEKGNRPILPGYGRVGDVTYVNSATRTSPVVLDDSALGNLLDDHGGIAQQALAAYLGVATEERVLLCPVALRDYVRDTYRPRGKPLSPTAATELINDMIVPHERGGLLWITTREVDAKLATRAEDISKKRRAARSNNGGR